MSNKKQEFFTLANLDWAWEKPLTLTLMSHISCTTPFLFFLALTHGASPLPILEFFFVHFFRHPVGCLLRSNCPTGRVVHPLKRPLANVREGRGSWKKSSIFYFRRGGHLSYLDAGGPTRGTQLMNMFVVTKFVINDCCLGSITSFFAPSRLFTIFIVIYLYMYSFFFSFRWREGM